MLGIVIQQNIICTSSSNLFWQFLNVNKIDLVIELCIKYRQCGGGALELWQQLPCVAKRTRLTWHGVSVVTITFLFVCLSQHSYYLYIGTKELKYISCMRVSIFYLMCFTCYIMSPALLSGCYLHLKMVTESDLDSKIVQKNTLNNILMAFRQMS